jgi:hypothetical protein
MTEIEHNRTARRRGRLTRDPGSRHLRRPRSPNHTPRRRVPPGSAPTCRRTSREACSVVISARACPPVTVGRRAGSLDQLDVDGPGTLLSGLSLVGDLRALRERWPPPTIAEWWTNRSFDSSSGVINPKPFSSLNHFTVPVAIVLPPASLRAANAKIAQGKRWVVRGSGSSSRRPSGG